MMFLIFLGLVVLAVGFFHYTQGFFSAAISAILCVFAAVLSISYHEMIVEKFLGGAMANNAHGATVLVLFAVIYLVCRLIFDKLIPGNVTLPSGADKVGAAVMGLAAGFFAAGVCAFAAQSMAFAPALMGYSRLAYEAERDASIPQGDGGRNVQLFMYDTVNTAEPLHLADADQQQLLVPADDILVNMIKTLSDDGALASRPLAEVHPNWLNELYGQRLGIQATVNRIAMNKLDGSQNDVIAIPDEAHADAGVYVLDRQLPQKIAEYSTVARTQRDPLFPKVPPRADPSRITLVFRVYFGEKAKDNKDGIIRFSLSSARLVTQKKNPGTGEMEWTNYYPLGTIEEAKEFWYSRPDDFLFVDDRAEEGTVTDKGVDLVFQVERDGFLKSNVPDPTQTVISDGTFIEIKRMARVDLSGQPIRPSSQLRRSKAIQVLRKTLVKKPPKENAPLDQGDSIDDIIARLIGTWTHTEEQSKVTATFDQAQLLLVSVQDGKTTQKKGSWKITGEAGSFQLAHSAVGTSGQISQDVYEISFDSDASVSLTDTEGNSRTFTKGGAKPPAADPATPSPDPAPQPVPAPAMANDTSLVVVDLYESPKFYASIRIPADSTGQVQVPGGTLTLDETEIKAIKALNLAPTTQDQLNAGTGEPVNRLAFGVGSGIVLLECTPGAGGWAWKDKVGQIAAVDRDGNKYYPNGVWAVVEEGKIVARFNADGVVNLNDYTPAGAPSKIFFAFTIPEGQQITKVQVGEALLKQFPMPLP